MRKTKKWTEAHATIYMKNLPMPYPKDNENMYAVLETNGYWWNGKTQAWEKESTKPSPTIFADKKGKPTGIMRLRIMCHPDETQWLIAALQKNPDFSVIEVSEKAYPNRHGAGERAYLTIERKK